MARVLEDHAKAILAGMNVPVPRGHRATSPDEARSIASTMPSGSMIKALVPTGRRRKAGLIYSAADAGQAYRAAVRLLGQEHDGYTVSAVLIEERIDIAHEYYVSLTIDASALQIALLMSANGGVDVEDRAESVTRIGIDPTDAFDQFAGQSAWVAAGVTDRAVAEKLGRVTAQLLNAFRSLDATLLEVNPLVIDAAGQAVAVGAMLAIDDLARDRQPDMVPFLVEGSDRATRPETELEQRVSRISADRSERGSARYLELDGGDIGFLCGGGGASLLLFDALVSAGGRPANYSEFGGNPTEQRVYDLTRVVLDKPGVRGLFVAHNITNNTQVDVVARGVTRAVRTAGLPVSFPVVAREVGVNDEEGRRVFEAAGAHYLGADVSLNRAAEVMVARMREVATG